jgi:hypothetical protein
MTRQQIIPLGFPGFVARAGNHLADQSSLAKIGDIEQASRQRF